jgi:GNAT superfamily N-acetyltransferase
VQEWWKTSQTQYTLKCVDTETNRIVGMALFDVYITPSDWKRGGISWLEGKQREQAEALISPLWEAREKLWLNERYIYCHVVAVHPEYQRKGVGESIFKYGIPISQNTGLPVYIESSKEAVGFYEKMGCKKLKETLRRAPGSVKSADDKDLKADDDLPLFVWLPEGAEKRLPKAVQLA